jgi:hypothetical protein
MRCQCWHPTKQPSKLQPNNLQNYNQTTSRWTSKCRTLRPPSQAQHADRFSLLVPSITIFNIWNPVREHNSCIKLHFNSIQFNSIQFNFTTTPLYYYTYIAAPLIGIASAAISRYRLSIAIVTAPTAAVSTCTISAVTADTFAAAVRRGQQQLPIESQQLLSLRSPVARGSLSACLRFLALGGQQSKDHAAAKQIAAAQCGLQRTAARGSVPRLGEFQWLTAAATLQPD